MAQEKINSMRTIYKQVVESAGSVRYKLRSSLLLLTLSAIFQGLAYGCFYPIFMLMVESKSNDVWLWLGLAFIFVVISSIFRWIAQGYDFSGYSSTAQYELRTQQGKKLRQVPLELLSKKRSGQWSAIIGANVDEVIHYSLTVCSVMIYALVIPITAGVLTLFFDWKIGLAILLIFPMIIPLYRWRKPAFDRGMRYLNEVHAELSAEAIEYVQGLAILKSFNAVGDKVNRLNRIIEKVQITQIIGHKKGTKANLIITSAMEIGLLVAIAVSIVFVLNGTSNAMVIAALMVIIIRFAEPISTFVAMTLIISLFEAGHAQIKRLIGIEPLPYIEDSKEAEVYDIKFENVSFHYDDNPALVLQNINLHIPEKSIIALVGHSGSGKSTLTKLIMRYADCQQGRISIGGIDIKEMNQKYLMSLISVVFQDVYLFDDTIMNNIRMAKENATDEEIIAVAKRAQCHDFISNLPNGYSTRVGDMGGNLSGGEKQRISIARALLKDTPIIILDEPTASLDAFSELAVQKAIDELVQNKIVIVIAHRLSTIEGANEIYVMDKGEIIEQGAHERLIANQGKYFSLYQAQNVVSELQN